MLTSIDVKVIFERHCCSINPVTKQIKTESTRKMSNFNFQ